MELITPGDDPEAQLAWPEEAQATMLRHADGLKLREMLTGGRCGSPTVTFETLSEASR